MSLRKEELAELIQGKLRRHLLCQTASSRICVQLCLFLQPLPQMDGSQITVEGQYHFSRIGSLLHFPTKHQQLRKCSLTILLQLRKDLLVLLRPSHTKSLRMEHKRLCPLATPQIPGIGIGIQSVAAILRQTRQTGF